MTDTDPLLTAVLETRDIASKNREDVKGNWRPFAARTIMIC